MFHPPPPAPTLKNVCAPTHAPHVAFSLLILFMRLCDFDIGSIFEASSAILKLWHMIKRFSVLAKKVNLLIPWLLTPVCHGSKLENTS